MFTIPNHILDKFTTEKTFTSVAIEDNVPTVFVKSGYYEKGQVHLKLINKNKSNLVTFNANISETEVASSFSMTKTIALSGHWNESITVRTGALFDIGFSLSTDASNQKMLCI
ncbi:MAG: metal-dependent HD superfamily phosphatase/phosphodiesterase [Polaribacter sp.]